MELEALVQKWREYAQAIHEGFYDTPPNQESEPEEYSDWSADASEDDLADMREHNTMTDCADELEKILNDDASSSTST